MIEFIIMNWMTIANVYLIGLLLYLIFTLIFNGMTGEPNNGTFKDALLWPYGVLNLVGYLINKIF